MVFFMVFSGAFKQKSEAFTPDSGARAGHADEQIDQLRFRCDFQQRGQRIGLAFSRHGTSPGNLKLHGLAKQRQGLHPVLVTQEFVGELYC
jgi:hypothetical protein